MTKATVISIGSSKSAVSATQRHQLTTPLTPTAVKPLAAIETSVAGVGSSSDETSDEQRTEVSEATDCIRFVCETKSCHEKWIDTSGGSEEVNRKSFSSSTMADISSSCDLCPPSASPSLPVDRSDDQWRLRCELDRGAKLNEAPKETDPGSVLSDNMQEVEQAQDEQRDDCKSDTCDADQQQQQQQPHQPHQTKVDTAASAREVPNSHQLQPQHYQYQQQHRASQYQTVCAYSPHASFAANHQYQQLMPTIISDGQLHAIHHHHPGQYLPHPQAHLIPNYQVLWTQAAPYQNHVQYPVHPPPPPPPPPLPLPPNALPLPQPGHHQHHLFPQTPDVFAPLPPPPLPVVGQFFSAPNYYHHQYHPAHLATSPTLAYPTAPGPRQAIYTAPPQPVIYQAPEHNSAKMHHYQATAANPINSSSSQSCSVSHQQHQQSSLDNGHQSRGRAEPVETVAAAATNELELQSDETSIRRKQQYDDNKTTSGQSASLMQDHKLDKIEVSPIDSVSSNQVNTCEFSQTNKTVVALPGRNSTFGHHTEGDGDDEYQRGHDDDDDDDCDDEKVVEAQEILAVEAESKKVVVGGEEEEADIGRASLIVASHQNAGDACENQQQPQQQQPHNNCNSKSNNDVSGNSVSITSTIGVKADGKISYQCERQTIGRECGLRVTKTGAGTGTMAGSVSGGIDCHKVSAGGKSQNVNRHKQQQQVVAASSKAMMTGVAATGGGGVGGGRVATAAGAEAAVGAASLATAKAAICLTEASGTSGSYQTGPSSSTPPSSIKRSGSFKIRHITTQLRSIEQERHSPANTNKLSGLPILMKSKSDQTKSRAKGTTNKDESQDGDDDEEEGEDGEEERREHEIEEKTTTDTIDCQNEGNVSEGVPLEAMPIIAASDNITTEPECNRNNSNSNNNINYNCKSNDNDNDRHKHLVGAGGDSLKRVTDDRGERCPLEDSSGDDAEHDCKPADVTSGGGASSGQRKGIGCNSSAPTDSHSSHLGASASLPQQYRQQPTQISINGTTFYSVPAALIQANLHNYHLHQHYQQQQLNYHMILSSYPYQGMTPNRAQYHHNHQQFALASATTYPPPAYLYHQNQPTMPPVAIGSQPSAHDHLMVSGLPPPTHQSGSACQSIGHAIGCEPLVGHKIDSQHHRPQSFALLARHPLEASSEAGLRPSNVGFSQLKLGYNLIPLLPIDASPTRIRQAYGMDKVWQDEFELLFSKFANSSVVWTLVEVESNPSIRNTNRILNYKGRYIVRAGGGGGSTRTNGNVSCSPGSSIGSAGSLGDDGSTTTSSGGDNFEKCYHQDGGSTADECATDSSNSSVSSSLDASCSLNDGVSSKADESSSSTGDKEARIEGAMDALEEKEAGQIDASCDKEQEDVCYDSGGSLVCTDDKADAVVDLNGEDKPASRHCESDCDSGAMFNSTSSGTSETLSNEFSAGDAGNRNLTPGASPCLEDQHHLSADTDLSGKDVKRHREQGQQQQSSSGSSNLSEKKFPLRFKMFIDSAKVRFCCDNCGHGWTSMKGRVVFWYELFELIDEGDGISNLIGYCAYKLFGQQCDVCKIEHRFERPMWYPEEVTKVLANLYNKIGQVYFGFKMPSIDKQRRAGKPKTRITVSCVRRVTMAFVRTGNKEVVIDDLRPQYRLDKQTLFLSALKCVMTK